MALKTAQQRKAFFARLFAFHKPQPQKLRETIRGIRKEEAAIEREENKVRRELAAQTREREARETLARKREELARLKRDRFAHSRLGSAFERLRMVAESPETKRTVRNIGKALRRL